MSVTPAYMFSKPAIISAPVNVVMKMEKMYRGTRGRFEKKMLPPAVLPTPGMDFWSISQKSMIRKDLKNCRAFCLRKARRLSSGRVSFGM